MRSHGLKLHLIRTSLWTSKLFLRPHARTITRSVLNLCLMIQAHSNNSPGKRRNSLLMPRGWSSRQYLRYQLKKKTSPRQNFSKITCCRKFWAKMKLLCLKHMTTSRISHMSPRVLAFRAKAQFGQTWSTRVTIIKILKTKEWLEIS